MGGLCSRQSTENGSSMGGFPRVNSYLNYASEMLFESHRLPVQLNSDVTLPRSGEGKDRILREPFSLPTVHAHTCGMNEVDINDGIPSLTRVLSNKSIPTKSKQVAVAKVSEVSSLLGRAGTVGLVKAVEVLDTLGSSMTNLNPNSGFVSGVATKGSKISILAFEVANTIVKAANLMQSLSKENIKRLKEVVLPSEGVQCLISRDMDELQKIAAADKRDELKVFSSEVVRFGNRCKDPQWHNLDRYFEKLGTEPPPQKKLKEAETVMQQLMSSVHYTAELYHELHALDRFEQDYRHKLREENNSNTAQRGDGLAILKAELKSQRKHVKNLKKKSLWSKTLEEVMVKLVDIVHFLHLEIHEAFGIADGDGPIKNNHQKLGPAGLALHYANIVTQIDTLVIRSSSVPSNMRDSLYQGLPPSMKSALHSKVQSFKLQEQLSVLQIKAEMEKTLQWLVPMATNTTKAHHGFGWVGEWANTGSEVNHKSAGQADLIRVETFHHAYKEKIEAYILDLIVWLHHLVIQSRAAVNVGSRSLAKSTSHSLRQKTIQLSMHKSNSLSSTLTVEDQDMLRNVSNRKPALVRSKSQEFDTAKFRLSKHHGMSKSSGDLHSSERTKDLFPIQRPFSVPAINFDIDRMKALDVIDLVDRIKSVKLINR